MTQPRRGSDFAFESDSGDFIIRPHGMPLWKLLLLFLVSFLVLFAATTHAEMLGGSIGLALAIFAVIGPLTWFTVYFGQQNRDMLLAAEFQNALFTAATQLKTKFVLIVKRDGTVFYYDRGFQHVFPETNSRGTLMIDKIFSSKQISAVEVDKLFRAFEEDCSETVFVTLQDADGKPQKVIVTIDPLPRPRGFYILRGRDFIENRRDAAMSANPIKTGQHAQPQAIFSHLLDTLPFGAYTTDASGNILCINQRLAEWLNYAPNEVIYAKLALADLLASHNTDIAKKLLAENCEGEVYFKNKNDQQISLHIQQEITRDAEGRIVGSIATVRPAPPLIDKGTVSASVTESASLSPSLIAGKKF